MTFNKQRNTMILLVDTALYYLENKEAVKKLSEFADMLCDLWGIGTEVFLTKEEERQISIICAVLRELQSYID